jgi:vacuolar-type H+-ATPase subunit I/STV1
METNPINNNTNSSNTNNSTSNNQNNQNNQNDQSNNQTNNNNQQNETLQGQASNNKDNNPKSGFDAMAILKEYLPHILSALSGMAGSYMTWVKPIKKDIEALNEEIDTLKSQQKKVKTEFDRVYERLEILEKKIKESPTSYKQAENQPSKSAKDMEREEKFRMRKSIMLKDRLM